MLHSLFWKLTRNKSGLSRRLANRAAAFVRCYNDFGYNFTANGEAFVIERLARFPMSVVFDVGANVGDWCRMTAPYFPAATFHAFELSESTRSKLRENLADPRFVVPDVALGATDGTIEYKDYGDLSRVNTMVDSTFHDNEKPHTRGTARVTTGDAYRAGAGIERLDFLKIDVEGGEYQVLEGFKSSLEQRAIRVIQFEYGYANGDAGTLMKDFYALLEESGYVVGKIWTAGVRFGPFAYEMNNFDSGPNYLAVVRDESKIIEALKSPV